LLSVIGFLLILITNLATACVEEDALQLVRTIENMQLPIEEQEFIKSLENSYTKDLAKMSLDAEDHLDPEFNKCKTCSYQQDLKTEQIKPDQNQYLIFISLSMPPESIKSLYLESLNQNATLVMCRLIEGSFKKTAAKLQDLKVVAQINPKLFKEYQIERVPTILAIAGNTHHQLAGNISFGYAKTKLLEAR